MSYPPIEDDPRLTAFALGEIDEDTERAEIEARLHEDPEARAFVEDVRRLAQVLTEELHREPAPGLEDDHRAAIERALVAKPGPRLIGTIPLPKVRYAAMAATVLVAVGAFALVQRFAYQPERKLGDLAEAHWAAPALRAPAPAPK